jgi:hypothetical protein
MTVTETFGKVRTLPQWHVYVAGSWARRRSLRHAGHGHRAASFASATAPGKSLQDSQEGCGLARMLGWPGC